MIRRDSIVAFSSFLLVGLKMRWWSAVVLHLVNLCFGLRVSIMPPWMMLIRDSLSISHVTGRPRMSKVAPGAFPASLALLLCKRRFHGQVNA